MSSCSSRQFGDCARVAASHDPQLKAQVHEFEFQNSIRKYLSDSSSKTNIYLWFVLCGHRAVAFAESAAVRKLVQDFIASGQITPEGQSGQQKPALLT